MTKKQLERGKETREIRKGHQGRDLEADAEAEARGEREGGLLAPLPSLLTLLIHLLRSGPTHSKLGSPTSMINQGRAPETGLQASLMGEAPISRELNLHQVDKN